MRRCIYCKKIIRPWQDWFKNMMNDDYSHVGCEIPPTYKYVRTFLTGITPSIDPYEGKSYSTMRIVRSQTNWKIFDLIYGIIIPRLKKWTEVPHTFDTPEEVRKFLHSKGLYDFNIVDMRPKKELR